MQNRSVKTVPGKKLPGHIPLWQQAPVQSVAIALITLLFAGLTNISAVLNRSLSDQHARWNTYLNPLQFPSTLLVIGIDDASVRKYGRLKNWSRSQYAELLEKTRAAKVVGLDILLTEPDTRDLAGDARLAETLRKSTNIVLPAFVYNEARPISNDTQAQTGQFLQRLPKAKDDAIDLFPALNPQTIEPPLSPLVQNATSLAQVSVNADADNVYRRPVVAYVAPDSNGQLRYVPHLTAAIACIARDQSLPDFLSQLPLQDGTIVLRSFARRGGSLRTGTGTPVPFLSFADAMKLDPSHFAGKVILVGETATGTTDIRPNAIDNGLRGVELNAEIVANLMGQIRPLRDVPFAVSILLTLVALGAPIWIFKTAPAIRSAAVLSSGILMCLVAALEITYFVGNSLPPWAEVLIAFTSATLTAGISRAAQEAEQRRQLQDMFSAYVAPEQVEELARNPDALLAGMKRVECAILFSDIRSFTAYSEQNPPDVVDRQMREYLTEMSTSVFARYNFLDKFVGDAVMALFGRTLLPPRQIHENYAVEAVYCAIDMLDRLDRLNEGWAAEGLPEFKIGIGIHYGEALFGNVGSGSAEGGIRRVQLTALGDSVNLAARLQTATKEYKATILVSSAVKERAEGNALIRERVIWKDQGTMTVRGREQATPIWSAERIPLKEQGNNHGVK